MDGWMEASACFKTAFDELVKCLCWWRSPTLVCFWSMSAPLWNTLRSHCTRNGLQLILLFPVSALGWCGSGRQKERTSRERGSDETIRKRRTKIKKTIKRIVQWILSEIMESGERENRMMRVMRLEGGALLFLGCYFWVYLRERSFRQTRSHAARPQSEIMHAPRQKCSTNKFNSFVGNEKKEKKTKGQTRLQWASTMPRQGQHMNTWQKETERQISQSGQISGITAFFSRINSPLPTG